MAEVRIDCGSPFHSKRYSAMVVLFRTYLSVMMLYLEVIGIQDVGIRLMVNILTFSK